MDNLKRLQRSQNRFIAFSFIMIFAVAAGICAAIYHVATLKPRTEIIYVCCPKDSIRFENNYFMGRSNGDTLTIDARQFESATREAVQCIHPWSGLHFDTSTGLPPFVEYQFLQEVVDWATRRGTAKELFEIRNKYGLQNKF